MNTTATSLPTLTTNIVSMITSATATSGGNITSSGDSPVTARGICWGIWPEPELAYDTVTTDGTGIGSFTSSLVGMKPNTFYYVRAYATNASGTAYGNQVSLTTLNPLPVLTTTPASMITSTTATSGGNIILSGDSSVTARGICWGIWGEPELAYDTFTTDGTGIGSFTSSLVGMKPNTFYYVRAYATNSFGTAYGNQVSLTTLNSTTTSTTKPRTTTTTTKKITTTTTTRPRTTTTTTKKITTTTTTLVPTTTTTTTKLATTTTTTAPITTTTTTKLATTTTTTVAPTTTTTTTKLTTTTSTTLAPTTTTTTTKFTTTTSTTLVPTITTTTTLAPITTTTTTKLTTTTSTTLAPTTTTTTTKFTTTTSTTLVPTTTTTTTSLPILTTTVVSMITSTTASSGGNITSSGSSPVTARGICWGIWAEPELAYDTVTTDGTGIGSFTSSLIGMKPNTFYYVRAYATNASGTAYGNQVSLTTLNSTTTTTSTTKISTTTTTINPITTTTTTKFATTTTTTTIKFSGNTFYVATNGSNTNPGTLTQPWLTIQYGIQHMTSGSILYVRGGTYTPAPTTITGNASGGYYSAAVAISGMNGTSGNTYKIWAYPGELPIINGSNITSGVPGGIIISNSSFVHVKGFEVTGMAYISHSSAGVEVYNSPNCIVENINSHHNGGYGYGSRLNVNGTYFINCDSHDNCDGPAGGGDADGFDVGFSTNNSTIYLIGCRSWNNSDDGFDMYNGSQYGNYSGIYYLINCWAWHQGYLSDQVSVGGDGCGFKYGLEDVYSSTTKRYTYNCIAYNNRIAGFNNNACNAVQIFYNNISYHNLQKGWWFFDYNIADVLRNNISYANGDTDQFQSNQIHDHNSWDTAGITVNDADFASVTGSLLTSPRQSDGSLPVITFLHLVSGSDIRGKGTDSGTYPNSIYSTDGDGNSWASPPALGPFEYISSVNTTTTTQVPVTTTTSTKAITTTTTTLSGGVVDTNMTINNATTGDWSGYNVARSSRINYTFSYNSITSVNQSGYMLQAGNDASASTDNNLDGEIIIGNKLTWNGGGTTSITHGLFTGHMKNVIIKYNYLDKVPMSIIRKSTYSMTNTSGGVAYNIVKNPIATAGVIKGMNGVCYYNNTFYSNLSGVWRGLIDIYSNTDVTPNVPATGAKIKNNIFYTVVGQYNIAIHDSACLTGFESDYNVFYCESGTPHFNYLEGDKTFAQWQALGYDTHSIVINPNFNNTTDFVPTSKLSYGTDLGSDYILGLSTNATWIVGVAPSTTAQSGTWQVGARVI